MKISCSQLGAGMESWCRANEERQQLYVFICFPPTQCWEVYQLRNTNVNPLPMKLSMCCRAPSAQKEDGADWSFCGKPRCCKLLSAPPPRFSAHSQGPSPQVLFCEKGWTAKSCFCRQGSVTGICAPAAAMLTRARKSFMISWETHRYIRLLQLHVGMMQLLRSRPAEGGRGGGLRRKRQIGSRWDGIKMDY